MKINDVYKQLALHTSVHTANIGPTGLKETSLIKNTHNYINKMHSLAFCEQQWLYLVQTCNLILFNCLKTSSNCFHLTSRRVNNIHCCLVLTTLTLTRF